jgi:hypothetical protein
MSMKKAQAAMEFLMTYGWAILVVLAAIGALAYFGVLSPGKLVPDKCTVGPGFEVKDCKITANGAQMTVYNGLGVDLTGVTLTLDAGAGSTAPACAETVVVGALASGATTPVQTFCAADLAGSADGEKFDGDLSIVYTKSGETLNHTITGKVQRKVEQ